MWTIQANVVSLNGTLENGCVTISDDGRIAHVGPTQDIPPQSGDVDGQGFLLLPGFIDLHVHGGGGADFMDGTPDAVKTVLRTHARFGTTGMLATTLTASRDDTDRAILAARAVIESERDPTCARLLGVHLEGPYICAAKRGAQPPEHIRPPDVDEFAHWLEMEQMNGPHPPTPSPASGGGGSRTGRKDDFLPSLACGRGWRTARNERRAG